MGEEKTCTWKDCEEKAIHPQLDNDGKEWSNLCQTHHDEIENSMTAVPFEPKRMLGAWVKAQGGAKLAAKRMM